MMTADQIATECPACGCEQFRQVQSRAVSATVNGKPVGTRIRTLRCEHCGKEWQHRNKIGDGPFCKRCGSQPIRVANTIPLPEGKVKRYRHCEACGYRWDTVEE